MQMLRTFILLLHQIFTSFSDFLSFFTKFFCDPTQANKPFAEFLPDSVWETFTKSCWAIPIFSHNAPQKSLVYINTISEFFHISHNPFCRITEIQHRGPPLEVAEEVTSIFNHTDP